MIVVSLTRQSITFNSLYTHDNKGTKLMLLFRPLSFAECFPFLPFKIQWDYMYIQLHTIVFTFFHQILLILSWIFNAKRFAKTSLVLQGFFFRSHTVWAIQILHQNGAHSVNGTHLRLKIWLKFNAQYHHGLPTTKLRIRFWPLGWAWGTVSVSLPAAHGFAQISAPVGGRGSDVIS